MSNVSKHSYNNELFKNLVDVLKGNMNKTAQSEQGPVSGTDIFSSISQETFNSIKEDEFRSIKSELDWAADKAKVAYSDDDFIRFASSVKKDKLKGKNLERAAQKFCSDLSREESGPQGSLRHSVQSDNFLNEFTKSSVVPAGYSNSKEAENATNDSATGRPMGSESNPNTIWDSNALARKATIPMGDEQIKASRQEALSRHAAMKKDYMDELQAKLSEKDLIGKGIIKAGNYDEGSPAIDQKLPQNSMSIFSDDRDFSNIPDKDNGQMIRAAASERANKKEAAKNEWNKSEPAPNTKSNTEKLFNEWIKE